MTVWRIRFSLQGRLVYLGHLDMLTVWERALRRCHVPVCYSQGFNPHMQIAFGPAHSVGHSALGDYVDIETAEGLDASYWQDFNSSLPDGIDVIDARAIPAGTPALMKAINIADYSIKLSAFDIAAAENNIANFFAANSVPYERRSPKGNKIIDFRPCVEMLEIEGNTLNIRIKLTNTGTPKPNELAKLIVPEARVLSCCRSALWVANAAGELSLP